MRSSASSIEVTTPREMQPWITVHSIGVGPRESCARWKRGLSASRWKAMLVSVTPAGRPMVAQARIMLIRMRPTKQGCKFISETDTEAVAHLVTQELKSGKSPAEAVAASLKQLRGAFALAFLFTGEDNLLIGARKGSPLAVGYGTGEMYLGSDAI